MTVQAVLVLLSSWMVFHAVPSSSWIYSKTFHDGKRQKVNDGRGSWGCRLSEQKRAVGDVVQGLHGGKYQFGDPAYGGSSSSSSSSSSSALPTFEGRQFAETGYGSSSSSSLDESIISSEPFIHEPLPKWATKLVELPLPENSPELLLMLEEHKGGGGGRPPHVVEIQIQNEERSWEMYYAFVVGPLSESAGIVVEPWVGQLAPRGGAGPFSDTAVVRLHFQEGSPSSPTDVSAPPSWLIVGTEAARCFYQLQTTRH